ncbi:hypothetical protein TSTA_058690 [Talaromyces stipitatus ATCC 10500]|uniref:Uncharacterized protein n=1 Tax=Talaromyces stipitatus (strain ATCC 10500 / CBS 375.48 / QM 6759 / NRRL 1006) TaxID=441959 RepID=B8MQH8_TALSN|nr:uncharacterized protein TSTA_058690 [Talaromyces stipitatus ATCC 10500]EED13380.1 hypothetical protein TSTA_058690 [Talaromyces stipitatus ATCC 10500]
MATTTTTVTTTVTTEVTNHPQPTTPSPRSAPIGIIIAIIILGQCYLSRRRAQGRGEDPGSSGVGSFFCRRRGGRLPTREAQGYGLEDVSGSQGGGDGRGREFYSVVPEERGVDEVDLKGGTVGMVRYS